MQRLARVSLVLLVSWLAVWGLTSLAAPWVANKALTYAVPRLETKGVTVDSLEYGRLRISPTLRSASAEQVSGDFDLSPSDDIRLSSTFGAREISLHITHPLRAQGRLIMDDFEIVFHEADRPRRLPFDRLTNAHVDIDNLPLLSPGAAAREVYGELEELFLENSLVGDFEFSGEVIMRVQDLRLPARLYTERQGDYFRLRFSKEDVQTLIEAAEVNLSDEQVDIISLFPLRVPFLIETTRRARSLSKRTFPSDLWLRDALRHISWSYLLTEEFGADFAQEVTNAQETKPGNTPEERAMDYHNNALGRRLATTAVPFSDLPGLIRSHPDVIRHPREVSSREVLWR